jgi:hypothetical protein
VDPGHSENAGGKQAQDSCAKAHEFSNAMLGGSLGCAPMQDPTLAALSRFPSELRAHWRAIPAAFHAFVPDAWDGIPSEHFAPLAQLWHLRDIERDGYHVRFRRTLTETDVVLADLDSYALAEQRGVRGTAEQALVEFAEARAETIAMLQALAPGDFARGAYFENLGPVTVRGLVHLLCSHDQQHLAGLQWLAGRIDAHIATSQAA